jgi:hypothetical protein
MFVAMNNARMRAEGKFVFYKELSAMLPKLLKEDEKLQGLPHRAAQMQAMNFERTLKNYIRNKAEFQRIDAKRRARSAVRVASGGRLGQGAAQCRATHRDPLVARQAVRAALPPGRRLGRPAASP